MNEAEADVLIEPVYEVNETEKQITVTVIAYAGNYKNFRNTVAGDSSWLRQGTFITPSKTPETTPMLIKKKSGGAIVLGILGIALVAGLIALAGSL